MAQRWRVTLGVVGFSAVVVVLVDVFAWWLVLVAAALGMGYTTVVPRLVVLQRWWQRASLPRHAHALAAMDAANWHDHTLQLTDLTFHTNEFTGKDYRVVPVPAYSDYVTVQLTLECDSTQRLLLAAALHDDQQRRYQAREQLIALEPGVNHVRLQLPFRFEQIEPGGAWSLRVHLDDDLFAVHGFTWRSLDRDALVDAAVADALPPPGSDGELNPDRHARLTERDPVTLRDLLAGTRGSRHGRRE